MYKMILALQDYHTLNSLERLVFPKAISYNLGIKNLLKIPKAWTPVTPLTDNGHDFSIRDSPCFVFLLVRKNTLLVYLCWYFVSYVLVFSLSRYKLSVSCGMWCYCRTLGHLWCSLLLLQKILDWTEK